VIRVRREAWLGDFARQSGFEPEKLTASCAARTEYAVREI